MPKRKPFLVLCVLVSLIASGLIMHAVPGEYGIGVVLAADRTPDSVIEKGARFAPGAKVRVTLHIYSGIPDPSWELTPEQAAALLEKMGKLPKSFLAPPPQPVYHLGYRGFTIEEIDQTGLAAKEVSLFARPSLAAKDTSVTGEASGDLEQWLITTAGEALPPETKGFVRDSMARSREQLREKGVVPDGPLDFVPKAEPVEVEIFPRSADPDRGDSPTGSHLVPKGWYRLVFPAFNPGNWNAPQIVKKNNCYNYATNKRTNTFAQPGRFCGHVYDQPSTRASLMRAAICDGLMPVNIRLRARGAEFPGTNQGGALVPKSESAMQGHLVALVLNPGGDYHWYRLDATGYWSHKPGKTPARGLDERGKVIRDPMTCSRPNYPQFCGYFLVPAHILVKGDPTEQGDAIQQTQP
jgi:hypothetical protein